MTAERASVRCPICADPAPFVLWADPLPPLHCPYGEGIATVTECPHQMAKARQRADWLARFPEEFDASGNLLPGALARIAPRLPADARIVL